MPGLQGADSTRVGKTAFLPSWTLTSSGQDGHRWKQSHLCAVAPQQVLCRRHSGEGKSRQGLQKSFLEEVKTTLMSEDELDVGSLGWGGVGGQAGQSEQRAVRSKSPRRDGTDPFKGCGGWSPGY